MTTMTDDYAVLGDHNLWELVCACLEPPIDPTDTTQSITHYCNYTGKPFRELKFIDGEVRSYNIE